jgi:hypothetical protein
MMKDEFPPGSLDAIALAQHGLVTQPQALSMVSRLEFDYRIASGQLIPVRPRIYRCEGALPTWRQRLMAVCLYAGEPVVASYCSAGRLWQLSDVPKGDVDVTVSRNRRVRLPGVISHSASLGLADITTRFNIPVTTIVQTLLDLSSVLDVDQLEKVLDDALRRKLLVIEEIDRRLGQCNRGGHRRLTALKAMVEARGLDYVAGESVWEDKIFRWFVDSGEPAPDRQVWITIDGVNYRIDLGYVDLKIAIEFDGYDYHHLYSRHISDRDRMSELQLAGWLVLPLTAANSRQVVIRRVREARALRLAER